MMRRTGFGASACLLVGLVVVVVVVVVVGGPVSQAGGAPGGADGEPRSEVDVEVEALAPALDDDPMYTASACLGSAGGWSFCGERCLCERYQGDCDTDDDCGAGLRCIEDVGPFFGWPAGVDVCLDRCHDIGIGGWRFCTEECPCDGIEGDCDGDEQCALGLVCVRNVGGLFGWHAEVDVCLDPILAPRVTAAARTCMPASPAGR